MENKVCSYINLANRILEKQEIINNNLSNLSTIGFKSKFNYIAKSYNKINKHVENKIVNYYDDSIGKLNYTNKPLDLAIINKNGWFLVKTQTSRFYLTRNGNIKIDKKNALNINNNFIIGTNNNPIFIPKNYFPKIKNDGTVVINIKKNFVNKEKVIGKIKLIKIDINKLKEINHGLFKVKKDYEKCLKENDKLEIKTGVLEESNVNPMSNVVNSTYNSRMFGIIMKIISTRNENGKKINKILNINN
ncbi:MAG: flagellar basal body rod protein FlgF [Buchnera aphidicola (Ceratovacuna japonica)]